MNKALTVLALIGSASAANTLLRDQGTTLSYQMFPNYSSNAAAVAIIATVLEYSYVPTGTVKKGGYMCVRSGAVYAFPQFVANASSTQTLDAATNTALVAFYGADTAGATLGIAPGTAAADLNSATNTDFLNSGCGQAYGQGTASPVTTAAANFMTTILTLVDSSAGTILPSRLYYVGNHNYGLNTAFMAAGQSDNNIFTWNNDFLLAAQWQDGVTTAGTEAAGTDFCSINYRTLAAATTTAVASANTGFNQDYKCTFEASVAIDIGAPKFKITAASATTFQLQWAEWEAGVLTAKTDLVDTTNAAPYYLGSAANLGTTEAQWPNPIVSYTILGAATNAANSIATSASLMDNSPAMTGYANSIGNVKWFPSAGASVASPTSLTAYSTMDFMSLKSTYDTYQSQKTTYESSLSSYNTLKDAYNTALAAEKVRQADFFKATFEPAVVIPERPCQPTRLAALSAVDFKYTPTAALATADKTANQSVFTFGDGAPAAAASYRSGYLVASSSTAFVSTDNVGHVYGLLGQDTTAVSDTSIKGWQWKTASATALHYQMVSILPYTTLTTLTTAAQISMTFEVAAWNTDYASVAKPSQPADSSAPDSVGAKALAASAVAVAAVAASLF